MTRRFDVVAAIEACYRQVPEEQAWLEGIVDAVEPLARDGTVTARIQEPRGKGGLATRRSAQRGFPSDWARTLDAVQASVPSRLVRTFYRPWPPVRRALAAARWLGRWAVPVAGLGLLALGADDSWGVVAATPEGPVLDLGLPFRGKGNLPPRTVHQLTLLSAHLATGLRLRDRLAAGAGCPLEAALGPDGQVRHATGPAASPGSLESLALAVRRVERARGTLRVAAPDEAARLWSGLVDGSWTLVDTCEADGRRLVLARRNEPRLDDPRTLTVQQRAVLAHAAAGCSNKYVAYLLGLAPSTVAQHLAVAQRKLGLRSRRELLALGREVRPFLVPPGDRPTT